MVLDFAGAVLDVAVGDLERAHDFYAILIGRPCDLRPQPGQCEWRLHREPEVALRVTADGVAAGHGTVAVGVADLAAERSRLLGDWPDLPEPAVKPGIIARLTFPDPDGNTVVLWQDLMGTRRG